MALSPTMSRLTDKVMRNILARSLGGVKIIKSADGLKPFVNIFSFGFDTLRLGLPKVSREYHSNNMNLQALCDSIGANLFPFLYFEIDNRKPCYTDDRRLHRLFHANSKFRDKSFRKYFKYTGGVWVIEYKGAYHWIIDRMSSNRLSFEVYGLSQLDHDLGVVRFELVNQVIAFYASNSNVNKVYLDGYDFHIDIPISFDHSLKNFVVPKIYLSNKKLKRGKQRLYTKQYGTIYLQPFIKNIASKEYVYDKTFKNDLDFPLSRLERCVKLDMEDKKIALNSYDDLCGLYSNELSRVGFIITTK